MVNDKMEVKRNTTYDFLGVDEEQLGLIRKAIEMYCGNLKSKITATNDPMLRVLYEAYYENACKIEKLLAENFPDNLGILDKTNNL